MESAQRLALAVATGVLLALLPGCSTSGSDDPNVFKPVDTSKVMKTSEEAAVKVPPRVKGRVRR